ncbi:MAG: CRISPR-associated endonuclease Cas2 [Nitrospirota bacterium]|nr:CRISPR-associated endonuclease Cas2 [Nitrospirota bacterium]
MKGIADYAVIYDITSDAERTRVDKTLKDFGFRVQKSVYECRLGRKDRDELMERLENLNIETGFIKVYRLEHSFRRRTIGEKRGPDIDEGHAFII